MRHGRRFLAVDASSVRERGETGSLWRVHWCVDLGSLSCTHFELTDMHGGEKFARFLLRAGDVVMRDHGKCCELHRPNKHQCAATAFAVQSDWLHHSYAQA